MVLSVRSVRDLTLFLCFTERLSALTLYIIISISYALVNKMGRWVNLYVTHDQLEAEMIKDILESGGIEVVIDSAKLTPYPVNVGKMGEVKLLVKEEDKETAEEILRTAPQEGSGTAPEEGS